MRTLPSPGTGTTPTTSGQGFTVEVNPNSGALFAAWYTYAPNGAAAGAAGQRWYTAQGTFTPGLRSIPVTIYETTGGIFNTPTPPGQQTVAVGTGTLAFQSCTAATFSYNFTRGSSSGLSGTINLSRVGADAPRLHVMKPKPNAGRQHDLCHLVHLRPRRHANVAGPLPQARLRPSTTGTL